MCHSIVCFNTQKYFTVPLGVPGSPCSQKGDGPISRWLFLECRGLERVGERLRALQSNAERCQASKRLGATWRKLERLSGWRNWERPKGLGECWKRMERDGNFKQVHAFRWHFLFFALLKGLKQDLPSTKVPPCPLRQRSRTAPHHHQGLGTRWLPHSLQGVA